jgi:[ribosomal protein S5]-alanine N-acetyltransferase
MISVMSRQQAIETHRLYMKRPALADVPRLFQFLGNAEAMKFTHADGSLKECRQRVAVHEYYRRKDGVAPWTVILKSNQEIIGWGGLYIDPFDRRWGVEVGYYFDPAYWGQGYASELVAAAIDLADGAVGLKEVWAFARPENKSSGRVLEKAGFKIDRWVPEMERNLYRRARR